MKRFTVVLLMLFLVTSCAFHWFDQLSLPPQLHTLNLDYTTDNTLFVRKLRHHLINANVDLNHAHYTLKILRVNSSSQLVTIGTSAQSRVYDIRMSIAFSLHRDNKVIIPPQTLRAERQLTLDANQLLTTNHQANIMRDTLERDIILQLFNRLNAQSTQLKLKAHEMRARPTQKATH